MSKSTKLLLAAAVMAVPAVGLAVGGGSFNKKVHDYIASPASTQVVDAKIHEYLVAHPEVLIEMSNALKQKQAANASAQAAGAILAHHQVLFDDKTDPSVGAADADVTIVEFFDYECPFCKHIAPELTDLLGADKKVRVVFKEFPILGAASEYAAKAALASLNQGKYEAFHNALLADKTAEHKLTSEHILELAKSVGLDTARLKVDMEAKAVSDKIAANRKLAQEMGISGTPGVLVGGRMTPGFVDAAELKRLVTEERAHPLLKPVVDGHANPPLKK